MAALKRARPATNPRVRLLVDCPACQHEQTEPFTDAKPLPIGRPFACWNCGQSIIIAASDAELVAHVSRPLRKS